MWLVLLCLVGNAVALAVDRCGRAVLRPTLRTSCRLSSAELQPAARSSSVELGGAARRTFRTPQVSNLGRVRSAEGIITEGSEHPSGYMLASVNGRRDRVHRLVAQAFLGPPPSEKHTQVMHIDGDRANNRADNLRWVTPSENTRHSYATNAERKSSAPKRSKPVLGRRHGSEGEWVEYESASAAAQALGVNGGSVRACCRGRQKRAGKYEFKWAPLAEDQHDRPGEEWREVRLECGASRMVSNLGRVRSVDGIITEGTDHASGYRDAQINGRKHRVHRLVAQAFLEPPPSEKHTQVNHIDGDPANNRADNLQWVTHSQNVQHSYDTNTERKSSAPKKSKPVLCRRQGSEGEWVEYESASAAARALGVRSSGVSACCSGIQKRTGEYEFKWAPLAEDQHDRPGEEWREVQLECGASWRVSKRKPVLGRRYGSQGEWVEYESVNAAARALGVSLGGVSECCRGKRKGKRTGGYEFKWAPPAEDQCDTGPERSGGRCGYRY